MGRRARLDGGLPAWAAAGLGTDERARDGRACARRRARARGRCRAETGAKDFKGTREALVKTKAKMVQRHRRRRTKSSTRGARRVSRRNERTARACVRDTSGSKNVFFGELLNEDKTFKSRRIFDAFGDGWI